MTLEQYATDSYGTKLHWQVSLPSGTGTHPAILQVHGGGFWKGGIGGALPGLTDAGFIVFNPEYPLVLPGRLDGQTSSGCFPQQTDAIQIAYDTAKNDPRCNGSVQFVGGSAGGYEAAWFAALGLSTAVCMSPVTQLDATGNANFTKDCYNYAGPDNLVEASPNTHVGPNSKPVFTRSYTIDQLPASQYTLYKAAYEAAAIEHDFALLPGKGHSFKMWPIVKSATIAWLLAHQ